MSTFSDSFTNTASTSLESHTGWDKWEGPLGDFLRIASNGTSLTTVNGYESTSRHTYNCVGLSSSATDSMARVKIVSLGASDFQYVGLALRIGNSGNPEGYFAQFQRTSGGSYQYRIQKRVSGVTSEPVAWTGTTAWAEGDTVEFRAVGTTLSVYNGTTLLTSITDTSLSSGYVGLTAYRDTGAGTTVAVLDDFFGNDAYSAGTKKLKLKTTSNAASATSIQGAVFASSAGIAGAKIGEFTGKTFEASLESGEAVLKVPVADFGGTSLTTSDTPVATVRNTTHSTGIISCTVIEE